MHALILKLEFVTHGYQLWLQFQKKKTKNKKLIGTSSIIYIECLPYECAFDEVLKQIENKADSKFYCYDCFYLFFFWIHFIEFRIGQ